MTANVKRNKSIEKYQRNNIQRVVTKLNINTDIDILAHLEEIDNKQGYIKALIRRDIEKGAKCPDCIIQDKKNRYAFDLVCKKYVTYFNNVSNVLNSNDILTVEEFKKSIMEELKDE